jgi:hypothetical protein
MGFFFKFVPLFPSFFFWIIGPLFHMTQIGAALEMRDHINIGPVRSVKAVHSGFIMVALVGRRPLDLISISYGFGAFLAFCPFWRDYSVFRY